MPSDIQPLPLPDGIELGPLVPPYHGSVRICLVACFADMPLAGAVSLRLELDVPVGDRFRQSFQSLVRESRDFLHVVNALITAAALIFPGCSLL